MENVAAKTLPQGFAGEWTERGGFLPSAVRNPQIAEEKKSLMDGKKSAAVRALREACRSYFVEPDRVELYLLFAGSPGTTAATPS